jgi:hypothetical protein
VINTKQRGRIPGTKVSIAKMAALVSDAPRGSGSRQISVGFHRARMQRSVPCLFSYVPPFSFEINVLQARFPRTSRTGTVALGREDRPQERVRRETGVMSTSLVQPHSATSWKQEVNLRLAAHRSRPPPLPVVGLQPAAAAPRSPHAWPRAMPMPPATASCMPPKMMPWINFPQ